MKTIIKANITPPARDLASLLDLGNPHAGKAVVTATYDDGSEGVCLSYSADELHFSPAEFVGLTDEQVGELFHRKDVAYLRR